MPLPRVFSVPKTKRSEIDPARLAEILAGPEIARQQAKAAMFQSAAQLPNQIAQTIQQNQKLKTEQAAITDQLAEKRRERLPIEQAAPGLYNTWKSMGLDLRGVQFKEAKEVGPVLLPILKQQEIGNGFMWDSKNKTPIPIPDAMGRISAGQAKIVGAFQPTTVIDPTTGKEAFKMPRGAKFQPGVLPTAEQKQEAGNLESALTSLRFLKTKYSKVPSGLIKGGLTRLGAATGQFAPEAAGISGARNAVAVKIYRAFTKDTRLSDSDAATRALPLLPQISDSKANQDAKFDYLEKALSSGVLPKELQKFSKPKSEKPAPEKTESRYDQLKRSGLPEDQIYKILSKEGY